MLFGRKPHLNVVKNTNNHAGYQEDFNNFRPKVYQIIAEETGWDVSEIHDDDNMIGGLGIDELVFFEILKRLEQEYGLNIPEYYDAMDYMVTAKDAVWYVVFHRP